MNCIHCNQAISNREFDKIFFDPSHPSKDIGPLCEECIHKVRVCTSCHSQTIVKEFSEESHFNLFSRHITGPGWTCSACEESMTVCSSCGGQCCDPIKIDGAELCTKCLNAKYFMCASCEEYHPVEEEVRDHLTKAKWKGYFGKYERACRECFDNKGSRFKEYKVEECPRCGKIHSDSECEGYCKQCHRSLEPCVTCGKRHHMSRSYSVVISTDSSSIYLCPKCSHRYNKCDSCGSLTKNKKKGRTVACGRCADKKTCPICGDLHHLMENGHCSRCTAAYLDNKCSCGALRDYQGDCRSCNEYSSIYSYSYKPPVYMNKMKGEVTPMMFGIENEVTYGNSSRKRRDALVRIYKTMDPSLIHCKSDGSISGEGFEQVTQPMSLKYFHKLDLTTLFDSDMNVSSSCGMHVHVSRTAFLSDIHIFKVTKFLHDHLPEVDAIAGRSYSSYCSKIEGKISKAVLKAKGSGNASRNARVNLSNQVTVEFRLFAACVDQKEMRTRVEFLHALISWARKASLASMQSWDKFHDYAMTRKRKYPNLIKYLVSNSQ